MEGLKIIVMKYVRNQFYDRKLEHPLKNIIKLIQFLLISLEVYKIRLPLRERHERGQSMQS